MSTMSEEARSKAKSKAERLVRADPQARVDASGYVPDGAMNADVQTGPRVISRRQYASGGVVGNAGAPRADRTPRASGGRALTADSLVNTNVKEANKERAGIKLDGGMKKGGRAAKMAGGALSPQQRMALGQRATIPAGRPMRADGGHVSGCECAKCGGGRVKRARGGPAINEGTRPVAGRMARKSGGRTKKGTTVNINIVQAPPRTAPPMGMRPPGAPPGGPVGMSQGMPPQGTVMPPPGAPGIPPAAPLMPRATGGRTLNPAGGRRLEKNDGHTAKPGTYPIESGGGGGLARLDKAARAARA
jgi:hypothetical protein